MACNCQKSKIDTLRTDYIKQPEEPCVKCAEKHFSTAYALFCECGYIGTNRYRIIGELVLSAWHIWQTDRSIAEMLRNIRHSVQERKEKEVTAEMWGFCMSRFELLTDADITKGQTTRR